MTIYDQRKLREDRDKLIHDMRRLNDRVMAEHRDFDPESRSRRSSLTNSIGATKRLSQAKVQDLDLAFGSDLHIGAFQGGARGSEFRSSSVRGGSC